MGITKSALALMLLHHRQYYLSDESLSEEESKSAEYAEKILKKVFPNTRKLKQDDLGMIYLRAYGILDDHLERSISTKTAIRRLLSLLT